MKKPKKMIIYNLFPLLAGPFPKWEPHIERAADMGFNWIFVNPIQRPGKSGSLYSIADYFDFHPLVANKEPKEVAEKALAKVIKKAESLGMKMMIDLVINHCSVDSPLLKSNPKWFVWESKGRVANPFCKENGKKVVWKDLAQFDHRTTKDPDGLLQFYLSVIEHLISLGFKGFRCDAAYQLPGRLWRKIIRQVKRDHPDVVFLAETLGCAPDETRKTAASGFDYIFNSSKWWDYRGHWLMEQYDLVRDTAPSVSFPESHDTERLCEELKGNIGGIKQRYLFSALFSAGVMMPMGFEFGFRKKLHVVKTKPEDWEKTTIDLTDFIKAVNQIKASRSVFQEEAPTEVLQDSNPEILVMWKGSLITSDEALLILNKNVENKQTISIENLQELVQAGRPLEDTSPEYRLDYVPAPFTYDLRPGQGMVFTTSRDVVKED